MRMACCLALAALAITAAPAAAQQRRVLLMVFPPEDTGQQLDFLHQSFRVGVASPAVSRDGEAQAYLDMSQGARISSRVYDSKLPRLRLGPGGTIAGWNAAARRADDAPGDVVPGLLGETIRSAGGRTAYVGTRRGRHGAALIAADRSGRIDTVSLGPRTSLPNRVERALRKHSLVVVELPRPFRVASGGDGRMLMLAIGAPAPDRSRLLPVGALVGGTSSEALLTSPTTRRTGMVALTDFAPTILSALQLDIPDEMDGRPIESASGSVDGVESLADRLLHIKGRRGAALRAALAAWLVALVALAIAGRVRRGLRIGLLMALWLPALALGTGAIDPSRTVESLALALGSLGLAFVTDALVSWPRAPFVPAAALCVAHAADLVAGSPLIVRSLAGPNPSFGARFYGVGNELEAIIAVALLLGAGAFLARRSGQAVPIGFATACAVAALLVGAGRLGADVGGVITLAAGGAAAVLASLPGGITRRAVAIAVAAPVAAVLLLIAVDLVTGGDAHLTRSVLDADSPDEVWDVVHRRFEISWDSLKQGTTPLSVGVLALALGYGVARRRDLLAPLEGDRAFAAGMWGALAATVVGALANDSGPTIFLIGATALVLAAAYVTGKPRDGALT